MMLLNVDEFKKHLKLAKNIVNKTSTLLILEDVLIQLKDKKLTFTSTDLEVTLVTKYSEDVDDKKQSFCVNPNDVLAVLELVTEPTIEVVVVNNTMILSTPLQQDEFNFPTHPSGEFPVTKDVPENEDPLVLSDGSIKSLEKAIQFSGTDELRPVMSGTLISLNNEISEVVATDAHRLIVEQIEEKASEKNLDFILPKKGVKALSLFKKDDSEFIFKFDDSNIFVEINGMLVIIRKIDGKYPNYTAVIPQENPIHLQVNTSILQRAVKKASITSNRSSMIIKLKMDMNGKAELSSEDVDYGKSSKVPINFDVAKKPDDSDGFEIGFNGSFFLSVLKEIESEMVNIEMSQPNRAIILKEMEGETEVKDKTLFLIMPAMLNK